MMKKEKEFYKIVFIILFCLYIVIMMNLLFFNDYYGRTYMESRSYNLEPLKEIKRFIFKRKYMTLEGWTSNLFGNVIAFIPLGLFVPILCKQYRDFFKISFLSLFMSFCIESLQIYYIVGIFDVDDMILNTLGGIIGYIIFMIIYSMVSKWRNINGKI